MGARRILILGGTAEASALAERLAADPRFTAITSLAGRTAQPTPPPGTFRISWLQSGERREEGLDRIEQVLKER